MQTYSRPSEALYLQNLGSSTRRPNGPERHPISRQHSTHSTSPRSSPGHSPNVSPVFGPDRSVGDAPADLVLISSDRVHFYTHRQRLLRASTNAFGGLLLQSSSPISVPEHSTVFNVILHIVHGLSCVQQSPPLETIENALDALIAYGVNLKSLAGPSQPIHQLLLAHAPFRPIDAYARAGHHKLEETAVAISAHLLAYDPSQLTDAVTVKMGPVYLRRLLDLHQARMKALKDIVLRPPGTHRPTEKCGLGMQGQLTQAWAFAVAQLAWDAAPGISTHALQSSFEKAGSKITCPECKAVMHARIQQIIQEWSAVKRTI